MTRSLLLAALFLGAMTAHADEHGMTQEEYEAYRARIQSQLEQAADTGKAQAGQEEEADATSTQRASGGYGQGYRARQERIGGAGSGAMQRGGGRR